MISSSSRHGRRVLRMAIGYRWRVERRGWRAELRRCPSPPSTPPYTPRPDAALVFLTCRHAASCATVNHTAIERTAHHFAASTSSVTIDVDRPKPGGSPAIRLTNSSGEKYTAWLK